MTTKEFGFAAATVLMSKGTRAYLKWYFRNVWKLKVMWIALIAAAIIAIGVGVAKADAYCMTTNGVTIYETDDGSVRTDLCSYGRDTIDDVWASLAMSKQFLKFWKQNFQINERYWMTPNGCIATWEFIEEFVYNRAFTVYGDRFYYKGVEVVLPDELDIDNDIWMFGSYSNDPTVYVDIITVMDTELAIKEYSCGMLVKEGTDPYANMDWWTIK